MRTQSDVAAPEAVSDAMNATTLYMNALDLIPRQNTLADAILPALAARSIVITEATTALRNISVPAASRRPSHATQNVRACLSCSNPVNEGTTYPR